MPKILPDNLKEQILATTRCLVLEQGYNNISIRDIAKACGIASGTFYNYFRSKQAVLSALLADDWSRMRGALSTSAESSEEPVINQLEPVFTNLKAMMLNVHELWAMGFPDDFASEAMNKLSHIKRQLRIDLTQTIRQIIHGHTPPERETFISDFLARMFFSYAYEKDSRFENLWHVIERIIS